MANTLGRLVTALFWVAALYNLIAPFPGQASLWVNIIAGMMLAAHAIECIVFRRQIREHHGDNVAAGCLQVILFGVLHTGQWMKKDSAAG